MFFLDIYTGEDVIVRIVRISFLYIERCRLHCHDQWWTGKQRQKCSVMAEISERPFLISSSCAVANGFGFHVMLYKQQSSRWEPDAASQFCFRCTQSYVFVFGCTIEIRNESFTLLSNFDPLHKVILTLFLLQQRGSSNCGELPESVHRRRRSCDDGRTKMLQRIHLPSRHSKLYDSR